MVYLLGYNTAGYRKEGIVLLCELCARRCRVDRSKGQAGFCGMGSQPVLARAMLHLWEEPCISGDNGSGAVFFSGCSLRCVFCQNYEISHLNKGLTVSTERLREIFFELYRQGAHNINLVNPTHFVPAIAEALETRPPVPVVYNTHGYDAQQALELMQGKVDIYLPDLKYARSLPAGRYSGAEDYFAHAKQALRLMYEQVGPVQLDENGLMLKGMIIRHLILPGQAENAKAVIDYVADTFGDKVYFSLMRQYVPCGRAAEFPEIDRRITDGEYETVEQHLFDSGLDGFVQEKDSASEDYVPSFDFRGVLSRE